MKKTLSLILSLATAVLLVSVSAGGAQAVETGEKAPPFAMTNTAGITRFLLDYMPTGPLGGETGSILILGFINTKCGKCASDMKDMDNLQTTYRNKGVKIAMVGMLETDITMAEFAEKNRTSAEVFSDPFGENARRYGIPDNGERTYMILGRNGVVRAIVRPGEGGNVPRQVRKALEEVIVAEAERLAEAGGARPPDNLSEATEYTFARIPADSEAQNTWEPLADYLQKAISRKITVKESDNYDSFIEAMKKSLFHIVNVGPVQYLEVDKLYEPIAKVERKGSPFYFGIIIARKDSGIQKVTDLKGKKIAFVSEKSTSGYLFPRLLLKKNGLKEGKDYKFEFVGKHEEVANKVITREFDAGACFEDCRMITYKKNEAKDLKIVEYTAEIPSDPILVLRTLNPGVKYDLREALLKASRKQQLLTDISDYKGDVTGFAAAGPEDYNRLREALR